VQACRQLPDMITSTRPGRADHPLAEWFTRRAAEDGPVRQGDTPGFAGDVVVDTERIRMPTDCRSVTNAVVISETTGADEQQSLRVAPPSLGCDRAWAVEPDA
jgi:hypothetical protein